MHGQLEGALEEHMGRLRGMTQRIADKAAADARFKELQHLEEVCPSTYAHLPYGFQVCLWSFADLSAQDCPQ